MVHWTIKGVEELDSEMESHMFALMDAHFRNLDPERFRSDLSQKDGVILLSEGPLDQSNLVGFSTYSIGVHESEDLGPVTILFSGDTVIHQDHWGSSALFVAFSRLLADILALPGDRPAYWLLLSKGFRTYLMLPLFFETFIPSVSRSEPVELRRVLDSVASERFGDIYDPELSIARMGRDFLKESLAYVPPNKMDNPHVQFFLERNPGFARGDELVCLTAIDKANFCDCTLRLVNRWDSAGT